MTPKPTHFSNSQLGRILHLRGCSPELVHRNADSTAFTVFRQIPTVATQTAHAPNLGDWQGSKNCQEQRHRSPVTWAAVTWPETPVLPSETRAVLCAVSHLDKRLLGAWTCKDPSALSASQEVYMTALQRQATAPNDDPESAGSWNKS